MGSVVTTPAGSIRKLLLLKFFVATDSNGDPTNASTVTDQFGDPLPVPFEVSSIVRTETGLYTITLSQDWYRLVGARADVSIPYEQLQGSVVGTVDLTTLTLSSLNTLTVIVDDDAAAASTTILTTPSSVADIAAQIQAQLTSDGNTSSLPQILTNNDTGKKYLKIASKTIGSASSMKITGTARATLGMGDGSTTYTGQSASTMRLVGFNTRGKDLTYSPPALPASSGVVRTKKTVQFLSLDSSSATIALKNAGFFAELAIQVHSG